MLLIHWMNVNNKNSVILSLLWIYQICFLFCLKISKNGPFMAVLPFNLFEFQLFIHESIKHICLEKIWLLERMFLECVKIDTLGLYRLSAIWDKHLYWSLINHSFVLQINSYWHFPLSFFLICWNASLTI